MSRLSDIAIRIEPPRALGGLGGGVTAILSELLTLLERLEDRQESAAIDLRSLPMSVDDLAELRRALGEGEVRATLDAEGMSAIRETKVPGVWWVEHRDRHGELMAELIEVTRVPQILMTASEEIATGTRLLREQLALHSVPRPR